MRRLLQWVWQAIPWPLRPTLILLRQGIPWLWNNPYWPFEKLTGVLFPLGVIAAPVSIVAIVRGWWGIHGDKSQLLLVDGAAILAFVTIFYVAETRKLAEDSRKARRQASNQELARLSTEHDWSLYLHHDRLPPALPSWVGLTEEGWGWRVLHFNHLDILRVAYENHKLGALAKEGLEGWKRSATFWFSHLKSENQAIDIGDQREGRETLRQVLKPEEGYPDEFRQWLRDQGIIPLDLFEEESRAELGESDLDEEVCSPGKAP